MQGIREADQLLCFRYKNTFFFLSIPGRSILIIIRCGGWLTFEFSKRDTIRDGTLNFLHEAEQRHA